MTCPHFDNVSHLCTAIEVAYTVPNGKRVQNGGFATFRKVVACRGDRDSCEMKGEAK